MNNNQQLKAINYTIAFLSDEVLSVQKALEEAEAEDPLTKSTLEKWLKELETDYEMFMNLHCNFN